MTIPLKRLAECRDDLRRPVNATERAKMQGDIPYWGANQIQDYVDTALVDGQTVLIGEDGAPFFDRNRDVAFYVDEPIWPNNHIHVLKPLPHADPRWLAYALNSVDFSRWISGSTRDKLTQADLMRIELPSYSLGRQSSIADYLDRETATIDALIEKQQRMLELLHQRATAVTSQLVWAAQETESAVHGGLPEAPASWNVVRNKDLWRESKTVSVFGDEEPLSVSHITGVTRRSEKNVTMIEAESYVGYRIVEPGDLVINTMWAWMGALGVSELNGIVSPAYGVYRTTHPDLMDCRFFNRLYRTPEYVRYMESWSRGLWSSRLRLYPEVFLSLPVPVPPLEEQREIADHLDRETATIDALIAKAERFIELAQERRAALITAAVTGQIEIPTED